jgi:hypothetical protein
LILLVGLISFFSVLTVVWGVMVRTYPPEVIPLKEVCNFFTLDEEERCGAGGKKRPEE